MTIDALPPSIAGDKNVCLGFTTVLGDALTGGTWSSVSTTTATVGSSSGVVTGNATDTATIIYTPLTGCPVSTVVTVNPLPAGILGSASVCPGATTTLNDAGGGTWSTVSSHISIGSSSGVVSGITAGTAVVTYTLNTGCYTTIVVTINSLPSPISGSTIVCYGLSTLLTDLTPSGTWSSSAPGTVSVVGGLVTGLAYGTATITYTLPATGCDVTTTVVVNPLPSNITGNLTVCEGSTTNLSDASAGTWSISNITVAGVSETYGVVSGFIPGTDTVTFTSSLGCTTSAIVTVNGLPGAILGSLVVCPGLTTSLSDTSAGTWSSTNTGIATVVSTGMVTGVTTGTTDIILTNGAGCTASVIVTVGAFPPAVEGSLEVCVGGTTTLSDPSAGGTWSAGNTNVMINGTSGVVTGVTAGTSPITYTNVTGCIITAVVTINPLPSIITGGNSVCVGSLITLTDSASGGSWTHAGPSGIITLGSSSGTVTGISSGTANVTYTLATGCNITTNIMVNPLPSAISGPHSICAGSIYTLSDTTAGGTWGLDALASGIAFINTFTGVITGLSAGTVTATYTLPSGCYVTTMITVNPLPDGISGNTIVCAGSGTLLSDATTGGVWSSSNAASATIGSGTGLVTGVSPGNPMITYTLSTGCLMTTTLTVNPLPSPVSGDRSVCIGTTTTLSDLSGGGAWSISGSSSVATVATSTGVVFGFALGTATVTYTLLSGCEITAMVTVNPYPKAITGSPSVCQGYNIILSDSTIGGTWTSGNITTATVNSGTGLVTGSTAGVVFISYTLSTGCSVITPVTVNALFPISGNTNVCVGAVNILSDAAGGGTWSGGSAIIATVSSGSGAVMGIASGHTNVTYTLSTGCVATAMISVSPAPSVFDVTGGGSYCAGGAGLHIGLNGSDTGISYGLYEGSSLVNTLSGINAALDFGLITSPGVYKVVATNIATGCTLFMNDSAVITAISATSPLVGLSASPSTTVCAGTNVLFTAVPLNGGAAPQYTWYVNGSGVLTGASTTYNYTPNNGDVVSVKLTSDMACVSPDTVISSLTMTASANLTPSVSLSVSPGDSVCPGTVVTINPMPVNGGTPTYTWVKNGITAGSGGNYIFTPIDGDNVFCIMNSTIGCALPATVHSGNNINMNVPPIEVPMVTITANPGTRIVTGESVTLTASVVFSGLSYSYQWAINNNPVSGATANTYTNNSFNNCDVVSCGVTGVSICGTATRSAEVTIIDTNITGVQQVSAGTSTVTLVPNPNSGVFTIAGTLPQISGQGVTIEITDMLGRVVYKKEILVSNGKLSEQIDLGSNIANGMYLMNLRSGEVNKVIHFVVGQ